MNKYVLIDILLLAIIVMNCYFIIYVQKNKLKYGINKLLIAIIDCTFVLLALVIADNSHDPDTYYRFLMISHGVQTFYVPLTFLAFYEMAHLKFVKTRTTFFLCFISICVSIMCFVPSLNHLILNKVDDMPFYYITSYRYTTFYSFFEAYYYIFGASITYQFFIMMNKPIVKNKFMMLIVVAGISSAAYVDYVTVHGILQNIRINWSTVIISIGYTSLYFIINSNSYNKYGNKIFDSVINDTGNLIISYDIRGNIIYANDSFCKLCNVEERDLLGIGLSQKEEILKLILPNLYTAILQETDEYFSVENNTHYRRVIFKDDEYSNIFSKNNNDSQFTVITFLNISNEKLLEEKYNEISTHDKLTGLKNRYAYNIDCSKLNNEMDNIKENNNIWFCVLDVDNIKVLNDLFGHFAGDVVIEALSNILKSEFTDDNTDVYRVGGNEFCVIIPDMSLEILQVKIDSLYKKASEYNKHNTYQLMFSAGYANKRIKTETTAELSKFADLAMHQSKSDGKNRATYFSNSIYNEFVIQDKLKDDFVRGIKENEIVVFFQSKYSTKDEKVDSAEALVRWNHKEFGILSPFKFLDIATELKLISEIDFIVFEKSCEAIKLWQEKYNKYINISVNLSLESLVKPSLVYDVKNIANKYEIDPKYITLEILENKLISDFEGVKLVIDELRKIGFKFAIDDFGSGFSNFDTISELSASVIKLDKSLVDRIALNAKYFDNIKLICQILRNLGCEIVAEGVETIDQANILIQLGVEHLQGYYYSKPIDLVSFEEKYLKTNE